MITNLLITGEHKIKLGKSQKLAFGDSKVSVKEIPLVGLDHQKLPKILWIIFMN